MRTEREKCDRGVNTDSYSNRGSLTLIVQVIKKLKDVAIVFVKSYLNLSLSKS